MSGSGDAAYPGTNGRIAFAVGDGYTSGSIWTANGDGGAPGPLTSGTDDYAPTYSADGSRIAFERDSGIAVMNVDGSGLTQLVSGSSSFEHQVDWEADYETPAEETIPWVRRETWTRTSLYYGGPAFSPDGSQLAVAKETSDELETEICAVEADEDEDCIPSDETGYYYDFDYDCVGCVSQILALNSGNGALMSEVTPASDQDYYWGPAFAADGKFAFSRYSRTQESSAIFVASSMGAPAAQVTSGPNDSSPDFSPDGTRLAFERGNNEIGVVGAGGGPVSILSVPKPAAPAESYMGSPVFSPDGSKIAFGLTTYAPGTKPDRSIYAMNADGSGSARLVEGSTPSWQPGPPAPPAPVVKKKVKAKAKATKGKVKLNKKGQGTIGKIACGSLPCRLKVLSSKLKLGKKSCSPKIGLKKKLAPGKTTAVKVKVAGKCLASLRKARKGKLTVEVRVSEGARKRVLKLSSTLTPKKTAKKKQGKHGGK
jgi:Tol biopolymer transport system component